MKFEKENYLGFAMRVFDEAKPTVSTLMIVRDTPDIKRSYKTTEECVIDTVASLEHEKKLYYIMIVSQPAFFVEDAVFESIFQEFLFIISEAKSKHSS
jgi:hypothetical protein